MLRDASPAVDLLPLNVLNVFKDTLSKLVSVLILLPTLPMKLTSIMVKACKMDGLFLEHLNLISFLTVEVINF